MPRPRNHDDQPRCDECGAYGDWHDPSQQYLCECCEEDWNETCALDEMEDAE